jgi:general secretion pathway protein C
MDLASQLAHWNDRTAQQWARTANRILPPGLTFVLVIVLAQQLATLTWTVVPGTPATFAPAMPDGSLTARDRSNDFTSLLESHLFEAPAAPVAPVVPTVVDAPDTTLSLRLSGTRTVSEGELADEAIIDNGGQQRTYRIGQVIDGAEGTTLHAVYPDRVILNRGGRLETLRWTEDLSSGPAARAPPRPIGTPSASVEPTGSLRQVIGENATRLTDVVRPTPHLQDGRVIGFRVTPGRDRAAFEALGLRAGDVVTDINGTVLDEPSRDSQVFESLGESTQANVTVLRDGVPQVIIIDTSQLRDLQNRE